jgi:hypothetical protein
LVFVEPIPTRPTYHDVPDNLKVLHSKGNYDSSENFIIN